MNLTQARNRYAEYRSRPQYGFKRVYAPLLTPPSGNLKFDRSATPVYGLALAPSRMSGHNVCTNSTPNCVVACVAHNNNGQYERVKMSRIVKTRFYKDEPEAFAILIIDEVTRAIERHDGDVSFRLNTFSDVRWEDEFPEFFAIEGAQFYDYTKHWDRPGLDNYRLTYSATERTTDEQIGAMVATGGTVAVVLKVRGGKVRDNMLGHTAVTDKGYRAIGHEYAGVPMIDGDANDDRTTDPTGVVVGLRAKGKIFDLPMAKEIR